MQIPKLAIEKAVKGGWRQFASSDEEIRVDLTNNTWPMIWGTAPSGLAKGLPVAVAALDPTFWQALEKSCGWDKMFTELIDVEQDGGIAIMEHKVETWLHYARLFYDLILTGGDTEKFWEDLLK